MPRQTHTRNLTAADKLAATKLKAFWQAIPRSTRPTQLAMAQEWPEGRGSQSLISQYLNGEIALNFKALLFFCAQLGCDPKAIRNDLPEQRLTADPAQISATHRDVAPRTGARPSVVKDSASAVYSAAVDTTLLTRALETAMAQFHAHGWMPATHQIAAATSFIYQHVHQGQSWKMAEQAVGDLLAKHGAGAFAQTR